VGYGVSLSPSYDICSNNDDGDGGADDDTRVAKSLWLIDQYYSLIMTPSYSKFQAQSVAFFFRKNS